MTTAWKPKALYATRIPFCSVSTIIFPFFSRVGLMLAYRWSRLSPSYHTRTIDISEYVIFSKSDELLVYYSLSSGLTCRLTGEHHPPSPLSLTPTRPYFCLRKELRILSMYVHEMDGTAAESTASNKHMEGKLIPNSSAGRPQPTRMTGDPTCGQSGQLSGLRSMYGQ